MSLNPKALRTRILAGAAAISLSFSVVACSEAEDAASQAGDAVGSATADAGSAINDADSDGGDSTSDPAEPADSTDGADGTDSESTDGADGTSGDGSADGTGDASGDTTEVETSDGSTMEIPSAVAEAAQAAGFSTLEDVEEGDNGEMLATFVEGHIANAEESGAQPLIGKIAETWVGEGGLDADIGLPTAPEEATGDGWTQTFTNGVINWVNDGSGNYTADIQTQ